MQEKKALQLFLQGDNSGLAVIYQTHHKKLLLVAYYYLKSTEDAEDVVATVFKKLLEMDSTERKRRIKPETNDMAAYLLTMVKNKALDELKKQKNRLRIEKSIFQKPSRLDYIPEFTMDKIVVQKEVPPSEMTVYQLHLDGYDFKEIAEITNLKLQTVKNKITGVRLRLRAIWKNI